MRPGGGRFTPCRFTPHTPHEDGGVDSQVRCGRRWVRGTTKNSVGALRSSAPLFALRCPAESQYAVTNILQLSGSKALGPSGLKALRDEKGVLLQTSNVTEA